MLMGTPGAGAWHRQGWDQKSSSLQLEEQLAGTEVGNEIVYYYCETNESQLGGLNRIVVVCVTRIKGPGEIWEAVCGKRMGLGQVGKGFRFSYS